MEVDYNWVIVILNMRKAQKWWAQMFHILGQEGANTQVSVKFYKVAVQYVLIYRSETWVLMPWVFRTLSFFNQRVTHWMTEKHPQLQSDGGWFYPPLEEAITEVGMWTIETYISLCQ